MLRLCQQWFGTPIPSAATQLMTASDEQAPRLADIATPHRSPTAKFWLNLRYLPSWRQRFSALGRAIFPRPTYMRQRYQIQHPLLLPLAYGRRWANALRLALTSRRSK